jgi:hypothetical protein
MINVELSEKEISLLLQSLDHCLGTCQHKEAGRDEPCEDCEAASRLRRRLANTMEERT